MDIYRKRLFLSGLNSQNILSVLVIAGVLTNFLPNLKPRAQEAEADIENPQVQETSNTDQDGLLMLQENSLLAVAGPSMTTEIVISRLPVVLTAYSSTIWETDEDPFITASGKWVRDGIVANNSLPFGTRIKIPEIYGDKVFVVEDRMSWEKDPSHFDIWFPSYWEAKNFGKKYDYVEVLKN